METSLHTEGKVPDCSDEVTSEQDGIHSNLDDRNDDMVLNLVVDSEASNDETLLQVKASADVSNQHAGHAGAKFIIMDEFEDELLIEEVKKSPILYDKNHVLFKDLEKKKEVWEDVGEQIGMDGEIAKKRWINIRDAFQAYLNRLLASSRSHDPLTIKKYKYAHLLDFLLAHMKKGRSFKNAMQAVESPSGGSSSVNILPSCASMTEISHSEMECRISRNEEGRKSDLKIAYPSKSAIGFINKSKRKIDCAVDVDSSMINYLQVQKQRTESSIRDDDGTESFFKAMAAAVCKLPNRAKAEVKLQIHQIVQQAELKYLYPINDPQVSQGPSTN